MESLRPVLDDLALVVSTVIRPNLLFLPGPLTSISFATEMFTSLAKKKSVFRVPVSRIKVKVSSTVKRNRRKNKIRRALSHLCTGPWGVEERRKRMRGCGRLLFRRRVRRLGF